MSFLILLFIAMPLKYWADIHVAVSIVGSLHGLLFILYVLAALHAAYSYRWSFLKLLAALVASVLPFGPFVFDAKLLRKDL